MIIDLHCAVDAKSTTNDTIVAIMCTMASLHLMQDRDLSWVVRVYSERIADLHELHWGIFIRDLEIHMGSKYMATRTKIYPRKQI